MEQIFISDLFVICQHTNANDIAGKSALRQEGRKAKKRWIEFCENISLVSSIRSCHISPDYVPASSYEEEAQHIQKEEKCSWSFLPLFQIRIGEISTNCSWAEKKSEERKSHLPIEKPSKKLAKNISCFLLIKNLTYEYFPWLDFFCSFLASSFMRSDDV